MTGFLPAPDPLQKLPAEFAFWDELGRELPKLLVAGKVRSVVDGMASLDASKLSEDTAVRRAMMILSFLGHAYVWGEADPPRSVPAALAVPWHQLAAKLGRPPVLSYASYALDNWRRLETHKPIELGNIVMLQNFFGGRDEEWFVLVHVAIEAQAGRALGAMTAAQDAVLHDKIEEATSALENLTHAIEIMRRILLRMPEGCDPYVYFHRVRPYIHGWANHPALPDGLVYEGVNAYNGVGQKFRGETGAQSAIVPSLDALLGVTHAQDELRSYLAEMRDYMPPEHRAFVERLESGPAVREFVSRHKNSVLRAAYNSAVEQLEEFRSTHLEYAHRYIIKQSRGGRKNPNTVGTGGTPFGPYLKKHRDETRLHRLK
jgi:indoleamine 2,3-dioxygenase